MAYTITRSCCQDASCVAVCPVNCIHPAPGEPGAGTTALLYIDPAVCIDCGACADECPVDAVVPDTELTPDQLPYLARAEEFYRDSAAEFPWAEPEFPQVLPRDGAGAPLRVAVVGSGPAACYAAEELLHAGAAVTMYERQPVAGGLVRFGVAPDHTDTRRFAERAEAVFHHPALRLRLGVEVGRDLGHAAVAAAHHAVVYAVGAAASRPLGVPGEELPGSLAGGTVVGWYNGRPDVPGDAVQLGGVERAVVVGHGNVALDLARMLTAPAGALAGTATAPHALAELDASRLREVVLLGRRGPREAAFTWTELHDLVNRPGLTVCVADSPAVRAALAEPGGGPVVELLRTLPSDAVASGGGERRVVLRFFAGTERLTGEERVRGVVVRDASGSGSGEVSEIAAELVASAVGYRGEPVAGLPFDPVTGTLPNAGGRVLDSPGGEVLPGVYAVGWIKRGATGGIGANRACAKETVAALCADACGGLLPAPGGAVGRRRRLLRLVR